MKKNLFLITILSLFLISCLSAKNSKLQNKLEFKNLEIIDWQNSEENDFELPVWLKKYEKKGSFKNAVVVKGEGASLIAAKAQASANAAAADTENKKSPAKSSLTPAGDFWLQYEDGSFEWWSLYRIN